jgi:hypothetical protein
VSRDVVYIYCVNAAGLALFSPEKKAPDLLALTGKEEAL